MIEKYNFIRTKIFVFFVISSLAIRLPILFLPI